MSHYYKADPNLEDHPVELRFDINGKDFTLQSNSGVFSKDKLDTGTKILLETVLKESAPEKSVLDLGCGTGAVGVVMGTFWNSDITGIDTNEKAAGLAEFNYRKNGVNGKVLVQDGLGNLDEKFDCILLNPPIRTGKETIYRLFSEAMDHLKESGALWIVIRKQHGAASAVSYLEDQGYQVTRKNRDKGFWVLRITK